MQINTTVVTSTPSDFHELSTRKYATGEAAWGAITSLIYADRQNGFDAALLNAAQQLVDHLAELNVTECSLAFKSGE